MNYIYLYLAIGLISLIVIFTSHHLAKKYDDGDISGILDPINPDHHKLSWRVLNNFIVPILAALLVIVAWPCAIYLKGKGMVSKSNENLELEEKVFSVPQVDLIKQFNKVEIEMCEMVYDPLDACPNKPFGHLNHAWVKFCSNLSLDDSLWSFRSEWNNGWGFKEIKQGYVIVKNDETGKFFLTLSQSMDH